MIVVENFIQAFNTGDEYLKVVWSVLNISARSFNHIVGQWFSIYIYL